MKMYRQGDILLKQVASIPVNAIRNRSAVILRGEATGHAHRILSGYIYHRFQTMFVDAREATRLVHEEHATIKLPKGIYRVWRQREYTPEDIRIVRD